MTPSVVPTRSPTPRLRLVPARGARPSIRFDRPGLQSPTPSPQPPAPVEAGLLPAVSARRGLPGSAGGLPASFFSSPKPKLLDQVRDAIRQWRRHPCLRSLSLPHRGPPAEACGAGRRHTCSGSSLS